MNPEYRTQGKCKECKVRHTWPERVRPFKGSECPVCGTPLKRTTHRSRLPVRDWPLGLGRFPEHEDSLARSERGS